MDLSENGEKIVLELHLLAIYGMFFICALTLFSHFRLKTRATPQLGSTPTKHIFMTEEQNMKKIEMPKPFQL